MHTSRRLLFRLVLILAGLCATAGPALAQGACTGMPTAGTASTPVPLSYCGAAPAKTLTLAGSSTGTGLSIQWQSSTDGATFSDISGAGGATYTTPAANATTYYRAQVSCAGSGLSASSNAVSVAVNPLPAATISAPAGICVGTPAFTTITGTSGTSPYTFTYNLNSGAGQTVSTGQLTRYVRIRQNLAQCFHLAEVQAIEAGTGVNVAAGKPVTSSGDGSSNPAFYLTDGILTNMWHSMGCDAGTWIEIDLGQAYNLSTVKIVNRQDCCQSRAANLQLILKNGAGAESYTQQIDAYQGQNYGYQSSFAVPGINEAIIVASTATAGPQQYNLVSVSDANGCTSPATGSATLNVQTAPVITTQPAAQQVCPGQPISLSVAAANASAYQWKKDGAAIPGATAATYTVATATAAHAGAYTVEVSGAGVCSSVTSNAANVLVYAASAATVSNLTTCPGTSAAITVTGSGSTPPYTFAYNINGGANQTGSTAQPTRYVRIRQNVGYYLNLSEIAAIEEGTGVNVAAGKLVNTNSGGEGYKLTDGNPTTFYINDFYMLDNWVEVDLGQEYILNDIRIVNRPNCCWDRAANLQLILKNAAGVETHDQQINAYQETNYNYQTSHFVQSSLAQLPVNTAVSGTLQYNVVSITSALGCTTPVSVSGIATIAPGVIITTQPSGQTLCPGQPLNLSVSASNASAYQWKRNGVNIPGATAATYTVPAPTPAHAGAYTVELSAPGLCSIISDTAAIVIDGASVATVSNPTTCLGTPAILSIAASGGMPPYTFTYNVNGGANQTIATNQPVRYVRIRQNLVQYFHLAEVRAIQAGTGINVAAGKPVTVSSVDGINPAANLTDGNPGTMWHSTGDVGSWIEIDLGQEYSLSEIKIVNRPDCCQFRASNLQLTLKNAGGLQIYDQQIDAYQGQNSGYTSTHPVQALTLGVAYLPVNTSAAGTFQYNVVSVTSALGCTTPQAVSGNATITTAVAITTQPVAQSLCMGQPLSLSVAAANANAYQWQRNGVDIPGATAATYSVAAATPAHSGAYRVVVSGPGLCPGVTSDTANVLIDAPSVATVSNVSGCLGNLPALTLIGSGGIPPYTFTYNVDGGASQTVNSIFNSQPTRYVYIRQNAGEYFNLAEVQAMETGTGINVAAGKPVTSNGTATGTATANLTDGDLSNLWHSADNAPGNWIEIDLGQAYNLSVVKIVNRADCCQARAANLQLILKNAGGASTYDQPADAYQGQNYNYTSSHPDQSSVQLPVNAAAAGTYQYNVVSVTSALGCTTPQSVAATATITPAVAVTTQPAAQDVCMGQPLSLSVVAANASAYQWRRNGTEIPGATAATYSVAGAGPLQAGLYDVVVSGTGTCTSVFSAPAQVTIHAIPALPLVTGYIACQDAPVPVGSGLTATLPATASYTLPFNVYYPSDGFGEPSSAPGIGISEPTMLPPLPPGATITSVTVLYNQVAPKFLSRRPHVRFGLSGAITLDGVQGSTSNTSAPFIYNTTATPAAYNANGGLVTLTYWETVDNYFDQPDVTLPQGTNVASAVVNFSYPVTSSLQWYTAPTDGTVLATSPVLDPSTTVGSGVSGTGTAGQDTFYAASMSAVGCPSATRAPAIFTVDAPAGATVSAPADVCVGAPAAVTLTGSGAGATGYTYTYNWNGGATQTATTYPWVRYIRLRQNLGTCLNLAELRAIQAGTGTNVAAGKLATTTVSSANGPIVNLTDGNLNNYWLTGGCGEGEWVELDLGQAYNLSGIQLANRPDCCWDRAANLQLILKDASGVEFSSGQINAYQGQNYNFVSSFPLGGSSPLTIPVNTAAAGTQQYNLLSVSKVSGCATTLNTSATVTVNPQAAITTDPQASLALCAGNPLLLSVAANGTTAYQWKKDGADIPGATTGSTYAVPASALTDAGSYQVIAISGGCNDTSAISAVAVNAMATTLANSGTAVSNPQPDGYNLTYTDASCQPIASITDNSGGNLLGMTSSSVFVDAGVQTFNNSPYLQRHYDLTPASNGPAIVKLYATQSEFDAYNTWVTNHGNTQPKLPVDPSDATGISHISITQFHGLPSSGTTGPGGQYNVAQSQLIPNGAISTTWNGSYWTMSFAVSGFSGFFISSGSNAALPVELVRFDAKASGDANLVSWASEREDMLQAYDVERSADGRTFTTLANVAAAGKAHDYHYTDDQPLSPVSYYRLRMIDADGTYRYSKTESVVRGQGNDIVALNVYPNPAKDQLTIQVQGTTGDGQVAICDLSGRVVLRGTLNNGMAELDISPLSSGVYLVVYEGNGMKELTKVTVAH